MTGLERARGRARSSSGFATVGVAVTLAVVTSLTLAGVGVSRADFDLGSGFAWLASNETDQALLVNGATGQGTNKVTVGEEGSRLEVQQFGDAAYVVEITADGRKILYRLDDATLATATGHDIRLGEQLVRAGHAAWLVDHGAGRVQRVDPDTLATVDGPVQLQPPLLTAPDADGHLVVVEVDAGTALVVGTDGVSEGVPVGERGDEYRTATVDGRPVVVNTRLPEALVYDQGVPARVSLPDGPGRWDLAPVGEGGAVRLLRRDGTRAELVEIDLEDLSVRTVGVDGPIPADGPPALAVEDAVFVVDEAAGSVVIIDPATGKVRERVKLDLPAGGTPVPFVKDGRLWVNDVNGSRAVIVGSDGHRQTVDKYDRRVPEVNPVAQAQAPVDNPGPTPPAPGSSPSRPPSGGAGPAPGADPGPGAGSGPVGPGPGPGAPGGGPAAPPGIGGDDPPPPAVATAPGAPASLAAAAGNETVTLTWARGNDGGSPLVGYVLTCRPDCGGGQAEIAVPVGERQELTGLRNGTGYSFALRALNALGPGPEARAQPDPVTPTAEVPPTPTAVTATAENDGTVQVGWSAETGGLTLDRFLLSARSGGRNESFTVTAAQARSGSGYRFTVPADQLAYDPDNVGDWSFTVTAQASGNRTSQPSAPSPAVDPFKPPTFTGAPTAQAGSGQVVLSWPAARHNGRAVTYQVARCQGAGCTGFAPPATANGTTHTVGGLTNGQTYRFQVTARNEAGPATTVLTTGNVVPAGAPTVTPGTTSRTASSITVNFTVNWNGQTGTCRNAGPAGAGTIDCGAALTLNGLNPSTPYSVRICARNNVGENCTNTITVTTQAPPTVALTSRNDGDPDTVWAATNASGPHRQEVQPGQTVQVACRVQGTDMDSNPGNWWYRIAQAPWTGMWMPATNFPYNAEGYDSRVGVCP